MGLKQPKQRSREEMKFPCHPGQEQSGIVLGDARSEGEQRQVGGAWQEDGCQHSRGGRGKCDNSQMACSISFATCEDVPLIRDLISQLAEYEKLSHEMIATEEDLRKALFGERPYAECLIARLDGQPAGFALFFHNFSTFLAKPGIYLEDLFVIPALRGYGVGKALLIRLAAIAQERGCGRIEWSVLDWNTPAQEFYKKLGALPMDEWTVNRMTSEAIAKLASKQP